MFGFVFGLIVGFALMWMFSGTPASKQLRREAEELGHSAQRTARQAASETRSTVPGQRERMIS